MFVDFIVRPVRASDFWNFGMLHMLQVLRRAQLMFPQLARIDGVERDE